MNNDTLDKSEEVFSAEAFYEMQINELKEQVKKLETQLKNIHSDQDKHKKEASKERMKEVEAYVDIMLKDASINIQYFPDIVERKIYRNVFNLVLNLLEHIAETTEVKVNLFGSDINLK